MKRTRTRKCLCCGELFEPDARNAKRQKCCRKKACRATLKAARQQRWLGKPENRDYFRGVEHVERVRLTVGCSLYKLTVMESLGAYIRRIRDERDISLRELAKRIGCTPPFVSDIEHGRRHPSDEVLAEIARVLAVSEDELRKHDLRAPIEEIKRVTQSDPRFAIAFRTVLDKNISADELLKWAEKQSPDKSKKK